MSGFDIGWLDLREPVDRRARNIDLLRKAVAFIEMTPERFVVDIGSGTGSTFRAITPHLSRPIHWRLIDHDPLLLQEATRRHGNDGLVTCQAGDLNDIARLPLDQASIVTASALFDLCSLGFIEALAERLTEAKVGLYGALNYCGEIRFHPAHPDDATMLALFNRHQLSDKGFGVALGPQATNVLQKVFSDKGLHVEVGNSDWIIDETAVELHRAFVEGMVKALAETGELSDQTIAEWLDYRFGTTETGHCRVTHADFLALPVESELKR